MKLRADDREFGGTTLPEKNSMKIIERDDLFVICNYYYFLTKKITECIDVGGALLHVKLRPDPPSSPTHVTASLTVNTLFVLRLGYCYFTYFTCVLTFIPYTDTFVS
jgi:hypothetical protein